MSHLTIKGILRKWLGAQSIPYAPLHFKLRGKPSTLSIALITVMGLGMYFLGGCGTIGVQPATVTPSQILFTETPTPTLDNAVNSVVTPSPVMEQAIVEPGLEPFVQSAKQDLADRMQISEDEIVVIEASAVVWPDGSSGCPKPGIAYIQEQQEGTLVRLSHLGTIYEYHSSESQPQFLCTQQDK